MNENISVTTRQISSIQTFCKIIVNKQRKLRKTVSTTQTDNKAHARKGKTLVALNANLAENLKFTFYSVKTGVLRLHFYNCTFPLQF